MAVLPTESGSYGEQLIANPLINLLITFTHVGLKGLVGARQALVTLVPFIPFYARAGTQHDFTMGPGAAMSDKQDR